MAGLGLFERVVEVGDVVDCILIDIPQHLHGEPGEPGLGISHRGRRIAVDAAVVSVPLTRGYRYEKSWPMRTIAS